ncbi:hypothetical protein ACFL1B_02320 [Nanoarchaeota archaeon]
MGLLDKAKDRISKKDGNPQMLPDTAHDMYEGVTKPEPLSRQVPEELPQISFNEHSASAQVPVSSPEKRPESLPEPKSEPKTHQIIPIPMDDEIKLFEDAVSNFDAPDEIETATVSAPAKLSGKPGEEGFFSEFHKFLDGNEVYQVADDVLDKDLLEKMKEYHTHKDQGKPYYFHSEELKSALQDSLIELRNLERGWYLHKENIAKEERLLVEKEKELSEKLEALRHIMKQMKARESFKAEASEPFKMSNGTMVKSLADLRAALRVMSDDIFKSHVSDGKNDFADWVREVYGNDALADALGKCASKDDMLDVLNNEEASKVK